MQVRLSDRHRPVKKQRKNNKSGKGKEWILRKKDQMRRRGNDVPLDTKYTGRKRKGRFWRCLAFASECCIFILHIIRSLKYVRVFLNIDPKISVLIELVPTCTLKYAWSNSRIQVGFFFFLDIYRRLRCCTSCQVWDL